MLAAGRTGPRSAIPWSLVGKVAGWTLAEVSTAPAGTNQPGTITTYLVDPEGGRYLIRASSPGVTPQLLAWSGDAQSALFAVPSGSSGATYELLSLSTGGIASLPLPANVTAVGFSRPAGENILAVRTASDSFKLQRYNLQGQWQATIGSLSRKAGSPEWLPGCEPACGALSSPDGDTDVWGVAGDEMQLVGNANPAKVIIKLKVPGADSCVPLTWWNTSAVLSYCGVNGQSSAGQLWLVPTDGSQPTQLTQTSGSPSRTGDLVGAWQAAGTTYATVMNSQQCQGALNAPGGLAVVPVGSDGSLQQPINVQGATSNHTSVVSVSGGKLLVLAQTACPGTSSLLRFDPSTGTTTTVLAGQPGQVGVLAAVPFGGLQPAATNGQ
jgi:TolB protein